MRLKIRIPLVIGAVVLITSIAVDVVALHMSSRVLEATILDAVSNQNISNAELLSTTLNGQLDVLGEMATRIRVRSMDWKIVQPALTPDVARIGALDLAMATTEGVSYYVLDNTTLDVNDRGYYKRAMAGERNIEPVFSRLSSKVVVMLAVPIFRDDTQDAPVIGALIARKDGGSALSDTIVNLKSGMPSGYSYLVNKDGTFIAHPDTELVKKQFNPITEAETDPSLKPIADMVETALEQRTGFFRYTYEKKHMIGHYEEVPGFPWLLFSSIERNDVDRQLAAMRLIIFITSFIASVIFTGVLTYIGSRSVLMTIGERDKITQEAIERRAEIERLMKALKEASETRTAFISNISNAMENPINNIIRLSSLVSKYTEIEDHKKELETINDEGMKLFDVINEILDILKIESGNLKLRPVKYKLPQLIKDITAQYTFLTEDKPVQYKLVVDEKLPVDLAGDELRIKQICHHILANSFKYTNEGSITVNITSRQKTGYVLLYIRVIDTGVGMTEEKLKNVFANYGGGNGGGIGLFICKKLAEMMKGTLSVTSEPGKGSVFTLCVPQKTLSNETIGHDTANKLAAFTF